MDLGYLGSTYKSRRNKSGFSMVLTVVIGLILTVIALGLMVASQSEVQVASNQTRSVSALNAAEAGGTVALNEVVTDGNSVLTKNFTANDLLSYMCASNSQFVSVKQVTGTNSSVSYRLVGFASGKSTGQFLLRNGNPASSDANAYDPLQVSFSSGDSLDAAKNSAVIARDNFGGNLNIVGLPASTNKCPTTGTYPTVTGSGSSAAYTYFPSNGDAGAYGLVWSTANPRVQAVTYDAPTQSTTITLFPTRMATIDGNDICSAPQIQNFKLSMVEVVNNLANVPIGGFRLVYSFTINSQGQIRTPSSAGACQGKIIGRQIVQSPNILVLNVTPPGSFAQYGTFIDYYDPTLPFSGNSSYGGKTHINTAPSFDIKPGQSAVVFTGEFTTAGCSKSTSGATCNTANIPAKQYGTISGKVNETSRSTISDYANFQGGAKYAENSIGYIQAPSTGAYQTKAALLGQQEPSETVSADLMKASDIQKAIGIKNTGTEPANGAVVPGVYWVNPTDTAAASTDTSKPADYNTWLAKASAPTTANPQNKTDNLLSGLYISGDVDYINLYAAKSSGSVSSPDQQVIEIRQTIGGSAKKFKFTITPGTNTTSVQVDTGSGYGSKIDYGKALNGVVVVDGNVGDSTVGCASQDSCRGLISIPPDGSKTTASIQKDTGIGIYANGNVAIQDNLTYQVAPSDVGGSAATNSLGVAAFPTRSYLDGSGAVVSTTLWPTAGGGTTTVDPKNGTPPVNGSIFWGNGLKDNALSGTAPDGTTAATVINLQGSFYSYTQGINPNDPNNGTNFADYINLLGGQITTTQGSNNLAYQDTGLKARGAYMNLVGDSRFESGAIAPPGYLKRGGTVYQVAPVGRQSIGNIRWQLLPNPNQ